MTRRSARGSRPRCCARADPQCRARVRTARARRDGPRAQPANRRLQRGAAHARSAGTPTTRTQGDRRFHSTRSTRWKPCAVSPRRSDSSAEQFSTWTSDYYWLSGRLLRDGREAERNLAFTIPNACAPARCSTRSSGPGRRTRGRVRAPQARRALLEGISSVQRRLMDPGLAADERRRPASRAAGPRTARARGAASNRRGHGAGAAATPVAG